MRILSTTAFLFLVLSGICLAHPYQDKPPGKAYGPYKDGWAATSVAWDRGNMTFLRAYPKASSLTDNEKYILFGTDVDGSGFSMMPWRLWMCQYIEMYYGREGHLPDSFSPEYLSNELADETLSSSELELWKNPISGEFSRFDNSDFTPGGIYIEELDQDDIQYYAGLSDTYQKLWMEDLTFDLECQEYVPAKLVGPVYYMRIYGENRVIFAQIVYKLNKSE